MFQIRKKAGEWVFEEGERGDNFYGLIVSVFGPGGDVLAQEASTPSLEKLGSLNLPRESVLPPDDGR